MLDVVNGSILGNPYTYKEGTSAQYMCETLEECVEKFEQYARERIAKDSVFAAAVLACYNKKLGCWCAPKLCHGEVLVKLSIELHAKLSI